MIDNTTKALLNNSKLVNLNKLRFESILYNNKKDNYMQNEINIDEPKNSSINTKYSLDFDDLENIKCEIHHRI